MKLPLRKLVSLLPLILLVALSVPVIGVSSTEVTKMLGLRTVPVPVIGTGSMYPSLYWSTEEGGPEDESKKVVEEYRTTPHLYSRFPGFTILGHTFFRRVVQRGDMVAFKNGATKALLEKEGKDVSSGFVKRVIGIPGDTIELRDGFLYRNGELLSEPYIDAPRSTYGGEGLADCVKLAIPPNKFFVLGDNRKISSDSRFELGLIDDQDISYVLPLAEQGLYRSLWRDTTQDEKLMGEPTLSAEEFVRLLNAERTERKLPNLTFKSALVASSRERGERLLTNPDTSYSMQQAISGAGYSNIVLGEFVTHGHFSAQELLENLLYNQGSTKQILNREFTDFGVSAVRKEVNGCPAQIIVGHLGGYLPASYDAATLKSWQSLRDNLRSILPSWEQAVGYNTVDQDKLAQLLTILRRRLALAEEIVTAMEKKNWLTASQEERIKNDEGDAKQAESLASDLNNQ